MTLDLQIAFIMIKDPRFEQASEDLESLDYAVFQAAMNTMQQVTSDAVLAHSMSCSDCDIHRPIGFCEIHSHMFQEVAIMQTLPDAPVFQGAL